MYPELTWKEEVLSKINAHLQRPLSLSDITLTPTWYGTSGRVRLSISPTEQSHYYVEEPVQVYFQRRDIDKLFIKHRPYVVVANSTTIADCLTQLFRKYGLSIDLNIFDTSMLTQSVEFDTREKTISIDVKYDASESWYGTFEFVARKQLTNDLNDQFMIRSPLTSYYPEDEAQADLHALNTYGIKLDVSTQDSLRLLSPGNSPTGHSAFRLAAALISMDYMLAWELITTASVVYNGKVTDATGFNTSLLPPFGSSVLILKPASESGISSHLYFSYD